MIFILSSLPTDTMTKLYIPRHDGYTFCRDSTKIAIFETLETEVSFGNSRDKTLKYKLPDKKLSGLWLRLISRKTIVPCLQRWDSNIYYAQIHKISTRRQKVRRRKDVGFQNSKFDLTSLIYRPKTCNIPFTTTTQLFWKSFALQAPNKFSHFIR